MPHAVPALTTAAGRPVLHFERMLADRSFDIEAWLRGQWRATPAPFYSSVDLRNAGYKLAPVDTNLFPAGFNNLNPAFGPLVVQALQSALEKLMPSACSIVLVPENHTRNTYYLEALARLKDFIEDAGYTVRLGSLLPLDGPTAFTTSSGREVLFEPLKRDGDRLVLDGYRPCLVLLHNDLSGGRPPILENLVQPVVPPLDLGWADRFKTGHFAHYRDVAHEFGQMLGIDSWFFDPLFAAADGLDFKKREGEDALAQAVTQVLDGTRAKYAEHGITDEPFAIVKADAGTYGMGVMSVKSVDEAVNLNRDARKKMATVKEGREVGRVIVQEGVYTYESWTTGPDTGTAEPVVYMVDHYVVGGFYRVHGGRSNTENLNAPGSHFEKLDFSEPGASPCRATAAPAANPFYAYGVVARLAALAAAREYADVRASTPGAPWQGLPETPAPLVSGGGFGTQASH